MGVSAQTLAYIRRVANAFLTDTCLIERESESVGAYGEPTHAWEVTATDVACRLIQAGQQNVAAAGVTGSQETLPDLYRLVIPRTITLDIDYRVTVNGAVYSVVRLETALTDESSHTALVSRQRGAG